MTDPYSETDGDDPFEGVDAEQVTASQLPDDVDAPLDPEAEKRRILDEILAAGPPRPALSIGDFARLARMNANKKIYAALGRALEKPLRELNDKLVAHVAEVDPDVDFHRGWSTTVGDQTVYTVVRDYPAYRLRDELTEDGAPGEGQVDTGSGPDGTGKKFEQADLIKALLSVEETDKALYDLVKTSVHGGAWNAAVQDRVRAWRDRLGESDGVRNAEGDLVDAYGVVLTPEESDDPTSDDLALPREIRSMVRVSPQILFQFRRK